ncbi:MAG: hypothetical protein V4581_04820 [Bacteroidota bacterium]
MYSYKTPVEAIVSLENAYNNKDLEAVIASKDFIAEAKLILARNDTFDANDERQVFETAELLKASLTENILNNGFPDFTGAGRDYSEIYHVSANLYTVIEEIFYKDGTFCQ